MKKEVSCVVIRGQLEYAERNGLPLDGFLDGVPYSNEYLKSKHGRIEWDVYCRMMANLRPAWSDENFRQMGIGITGTVPFRNLVSVGRLLFTGPEVYSFFWGAGTRSPGKQFFDCISSTIERIEKNYIVLTLALPQGYQYCREFFLITMGSMEGASDVIGLGPSRVYMHETDRGAVYDIICPPGGTVIPWIRRAIMWPFALRSAARELKDANEALHERYAQLEETREELQRQAAKLKVAYDVSRLIRGNLDLDATLNAIAHALVEIAGFSGVVLTVDTVTEEEHVRRHVTAGADVQGAAHVTRELEGHGTSIGNVTLCLPHSSEPSTSGELLEYVIPTIAMEIDGALSFKHINDYRTSLQRKVDERTLELNEMNASLTKAQAGRDRLFSNISHEFRTPLTLILGPLEKILEETRSTSMRRRLVLVRKSAGKLLQLINQLLDLSRLQSGGVKLRVSNTDLVHFLRGVVMSYRSLAVSRRVRLTFRAGRDALPVYLDHEKAESLFHTLLQNAFRVTPGGGRVDVSVEEREGVAEVSIRDSGAGIPESELPLIFDRFFQGVSPGDRNLGGTGIGLVLAKELAELHHGTIRVSGVAGGGTEFTVSLPLGCGHLQEKELDVRHGPALSSPAPSPEAWSVSLVGSVQRPPVDHPDGGKKIILVIDDDPDVRQYIGDIVAPEMQIIEASDGDEGIRRAQDTIPDLIISDVMMPRRDGYEVCRTLKSDIRTCHIPVILLTAKAGTESRIEGLEGGADEYIVKPFVARELLARVNNLISLREQMRERIASEGLHAPASPAGLSMDESFIQKAVEIVERHLGDEAFGVDDFSREIGFSRAQLHRKLIALTDCSARDFLRRLRLERAFNFLQNNDGNVSEIAYRVGFRDPSHFAKCFRKQFGVPPGAVRPPAQLSFRNE